MEISFERILSRCFYEREYRFFPPLRPILDKNRDPSNRFYYFFFNHISFLLSQARFSQLNAAWLIRPFLHSSCPTKRSFQPFSLSVIYKYHFHSDSRSKRKKKKKKITHQRPVHLDDTQKKETKKSRQIFQTINPSSCLVVVCIKREVRCDYSTQLVPSSSSKIPQLVKRTLHTCYL